MKTESFGPKILKKIEELEKRLRAVEKRDPEEREPEVARLRRELEEVGETRERLEAKVNDLRDRLGRAKNAKVADAGDLRELEVLREELRETEEARDRWKMIAIDGNEAARRIYEGLHASDVREKLRLMVHARDVARFELTEERGKREFLEGERRKALALVTELERGKAESIERSADLEESARNLGASLLEREAEVRELLEKSKELEAELKAIPTYRASASALVERIMKTFAIAEVPDDARGIAEREVEKALRIQARDLLGVKRWAVIHLYEEDDLPDDVPQIVVEWFDSREEATRTAELPRECGETVLAAIVQINPHERLP
jgi:chromosome segregation ATPase